MKRFNILFFGKRIVAVLLCLVSVAVLTLPMTVHASQSAGKVVRVGWYESPVSMKDASGRRTAYGLRLRVRAGEQDPGGSARESR